MSDLISSVARYVGITERDVIQLSNIAPQTYRRYEIPKKRRDQMRQIHHPSKQTKMLQYAIMELILQEVEIHDAAHGFIRGIQSPLRKHAECHTENPFFIRLDFKDFFPSIRPEDILEHLPVGATLNSITLSERDQNFLINVLFVRYPRPHLSLAVGAPSSPIISNIVMKDLDECLYALASENDFTYTRYADDLTFSTQIRDISLDMVKKVEGVLLQQTSPKVQLNKEKTCFMSKNCRRAVTGLIITPEGNISIGRKNKKMLRSLLFDTVKHRITDKDAAYLQGYLAFVLDVEPSYFNNLSLKYGADTLKKALKRPQQLYTKVQT